MPRVHPTGYDESMGKQDDPRRDAWWFLLTGDLVVGPMIDWLLKRRIGAALIVLILAIVWCWLVFAADL
jgi:hypothetical protein